MADFYRLGAVIRNDVFGTVRKCTHLPSGEERSVTIYRKSMMGEAEREQLAQEVRTLSVMSNKNILKVYGYFEDSQHFYIVSETVESGGSLIEEVLARG